MHLVRAREQELPEHIPIEVIDIGAAVEVTAKSSAGIEAA